MRPLTANEAIMATARRPLLGRLLPTFSGFTRLPARSVTQQAEQGRIPWLSRQSRLRWLWPAGPGPDGCEGPMV